MLEWVPLIIVGGAIIPSALPLNEKKRIIQVFENTDFCIKRPPENKKEYPMFIRKTENETAKVYYFQLPLGLDLADHPKLVDRLSHSLNRNIEIMGDSVLQVWIYKHSLPKYWKYEDVPSVEGWQVPIGKNYKDLIFHDFDKIPHMTVAGMTRYGKTVLLKNIFAYLIEHHADDVEFYIIDLKGGLEFGAYERLKQVKYLSDDLKSAHYVLSQVKAQGERIKKDFRSKGISNIVETPIKRRTFVIVDEGAEIPSKSEEQKLLSHIARVCGALGFRLIFATQYPTGDSLPREIKQNADAKITFRLPTDTASRVAIDESGATDLDQPGRAIYRSYDKFVVQVPYLSNQDMWNRLRRWEVDTTSKEVRETREDIIKFR